MDVGQNGKPRGPQLEMSSLVLTIHNFGVPNFDPYPYGGGFKDFKGPPTYASWKIMEKPMNIWIYLRMIIGNSPILGKLHTVGDRNPAPVVR